MIDLEDKYLTVVKMILQTYVPGCKVRVYGSRVKGTAQPFSDLDLAVESRKKLDLRIWIDLKEAFSDCL